jgi:hypothetical protein
VSKDDYVTANVARLRNIEADEENNLDLCIWCFTEIVPDDDEDDVTVKDVDYSTKECTCAVCGTVLYEVDNG